MAFNELEFRETAKQGGFSPEDIELEVSKQLGTGVVDAPAGPEIQTTPDQLEVGPQPIEPTLEVEQPIVQSEQVVEPEDKGLIVSELELDETYLGDDKEGFAVHTPEELDLNSVDTIEPADRVFNRIPTKFGDDFDADKVAALYKNINSKYNTAKNIKGFFDPETKKQLDRDTDVLNDQIAKGLQKQGFEVYKIVNIDGRTQKISFEHPDFKNVVSGAVVAVRDPETGKIERIDSSFLDDLWNSKFETGTAISGGIAGATAAGTRAMALPIPHPGAKAVVVAGAGLAGAAIGGAAGAASGRLVDVVRNSMQVGEDLEVKKILGQMADAGVSDAIFTVAGAGVIKVGAKALRGVKAVHKKLKDTAFARPERAYKTLKEMLHITDDQAELIVREWQSVTSNVDELTTLDKIGVITETQPATQDIAQSLASGSPKALAEIKHRVTERASTIIKAADNISDDNFGRQLLEDLAQYKADTTNAFVNVVEVGKNLMRQQRSDYKFDMEALIKTPLWTDLADTLKNPLASGKLTDFVEKTVKQAKDAELNSFDNLMELRKVLNEFKYSPDSTFSNTESLNKLIDLVDTEAASATKGLKTGVDKDWITHFKAANTQYANLSAAKSSAFWKSLTKEGVGEDAMVNSITKHFTAFDSDFLNVMHRLPKRTQDKVEASVLKKFVLDTSTGEDTAKAIHFPELSRRLKKMPFRSKETKELKKSIDDLAGTFKNDANLAQLSNMLISEKFQSFLTIDPIVRAKFAMASRMFNAVQQFTPTQKGASTNLALRLEKVWQNPKSQKAIRNLVRGLPDEQKKLVESSIQQLQLVVPPKGSFGKPDLPRVTAFKNAALGKELEVTTGKLGKGINYTIDSLGNRATTGTVTREIAIARLADEGVLTELFGDASIKFLRENQEKVNEELVKRGYVGLRVAKDIMMFE